LAIIRAVALFCSLLLSLGATRAFSLYFVRRGDHLDHNGTVPDAGKSENAALLARKMHLLLALSGRL